MKYFCAGVSVLCCFFMLYLKHESTRVLDDAFAIRAEALHLNQDSQRLNTDTMNQRNRLYNEFGHEPPIAWPHFKIEVTESQFVELMSSQTKSWVVKQHDIKLQPLR